MKFNSKCMISKATASTGVNKDTQQPYTSLYIWYLTMDNLTPSESVDRFGKITKGAEFVKAKIDNYDEHINITECPAIYDVTFDLVSENNTTVAKPVALKYISPLSEAFKGVK